MARPVELNVWTFLTLLVLIESSLHSAELDAVIGGEIPNELTEEKPPRNFSQKPSLNHLQKRQNQNQNGDTPLGLGKSNSTNSTFVNIPNSKIVKVNKKYVAPTLNDSGLEHLLGGTINLRIVTSPYFVQGEDNRHMQQDTPQDRPAHVEATKDAQSVTTILPKPVLSGLIKQPALARPSSDEVASRSLGETLVTSTPVAQDSNLLYKKSEAIYASSSYTQDLKDKTMMFDNEGHVLKTLDLPSEEKNGFEIVAHMENGMEQLLSSVRPTVSTISLVTSPRTLLSERSTAENNLKPGKLTEVQLEGVNHHTSVDPMTNHVEVQDNLPNLALNALYPPQSQTVEPSSTIRAGQVENNFDHFVPMAPQESQPLSEKNLASYRTTQSYSTLQERHEVLTSPGSNEVLSAYIGDKAESALDKKHIAVKNSKNTQTSQKGDKNAITANSGAFYYPNPTNGADVSIASKMPVFSSKASSPDSPSTYLTREATLETRAKTWTERLLAHQLSTRKPVSKPSDSNPQTPTPNLQVSFLQPLEMATPSTLALSKDPMKMEELDKSSAQAQKGTAGSVMIPKTGTSSSSLVFATPATGKTPGTGQLEPADRSTQPTSTANQRTGTASPHISYSLTTASKILVTQRRGQIRVTTQRALQRPRLVEASSRMLFLEPSSAPPCLGTHGVCKLLSVNRTLLKWNDLKRTLSFAWELHVYGTAVLFLILSIIALINLIGSPILHVFNLPYIMVSNALLVLVGLFRTVLFFTDPYATKSMLSPQTALVLYNITFPLILTTFAVLALLVLKMAQLQVLPPKLQSMPLLALVGVIHFVVLFSTDIFSHFLNPSVNIVLHFLSISWGTFLMVGNAVAYYKLRKSSGDIVSGAPMESPASDDTLDVQIRGRNQRFLFTSSRVLLVCSVFGLLCCGLQVYAVLWLFGILGRVNEFSWSWWFLQFWFRIFELAMCFAMLFVASHTFCQKCGSSDHTCWSKIVQYLCTYSKTEVPEYPNNCYDWANGHPDRSTNNDISKNLIRNPPESVSLRALKDNNENKVTPAFYKSGSSSPLVKPKPGFVFGPKSQNIAIGRSHTSICFEKDSMLSLADLEFRPPSPINLSRSIDDALFREHLVRDSIFLNSSFQYPSYFSRQDSCSSLKEISALNQTIDPLISADLKLRRNSIPDYMYSQARCSSLTDVNSPTASLQQSKDLPNDVMTEAAASGSSLDSFSKGSIKISWNPWRHGLSSVESLPFEEAPSAQLLAQACNATAPTETTEPKKDSAKSLIKISQTIDSRSISSDTIEL